MRESGDKSAASSLLLSTGDIYNLAKVFGYNNKTIPGLSLVVNYH